MTDGGGCLGLIQIRNKFKMAAQKAGYKNTEVKGRIFEKASSSVIDSGRIAQSIVKNSKNKDVRGDLYLTKLSYS